MEYKIIFYEKENHETPTLDFLEALRIKAQKSKNARIQYKQAVLYIELLKKNGTFLPENITKHIEENIWELRPEKKPKGKEMFTGATGHWIWIFCFMMT